MYVYVCISVCVCVCKSSIYWFSVQNLFIIGMSLGCLLEVHAILVFRSFPFLFEFIPSGSFRFISLNFQTTHDMCFGHILCRLANKLSTLAKNLANNNNSCPQLSSSIVHGHPWTSSMASVVIWKPSVLETVAVGQWIK